MSVAVDLLQMSLQMKLKLIFICIASPVCLGHDRFHLSVMPRMLIYALILVDNQQKRQDLAKEHNLIVRRAEANCNLARQLICQN